MMPSTGLGRSGSNDRYDNPFEDTALLNPFEDSYIEPDVDLTGQSTQTQQQAPSPPPQLVSEREEEEALLSGSISNQQQQNNTQQSSYSSDSYSGQDTLEEPVTVTIMRDLKKVGNKLLQVLHPKGDRNVLRDWDLWGPLLLCLTLAIVLSLRAPEHQAVPIFTGVFVIVWIGAAVVTLNAKMLGGAVSFFQSVCVMGYCLFPIVVAAIVATFIDYIWVRVPVSCITFVWSTWASVGFLSESQIHLQNRRALAVYPLVLFYFVITWLVVIS